MFIKVPHLFYYLSKENILILTIIRERRGEGKEIERKRKRGREGERERERESIELCT
jgi:hypothetical protein